MSKYGINRVLLRSVRPHLRCESRGSRKPGYLITANRIKFKSNVSVKIMPGVSSSRGDSLATRLSWPHSVWFTEPSGSRSPSCNLVCRPDVVRFQNAQIFQHILYQAGPSYCSSSVCHLVCQQMYSCVCFM